MISRNSSKSRHERKADKLAALEFLLPYLVVAGLFILLRRFERWLHQHIFKVGWLLTKNYETTTILYYTFFLPGVILHELVYWLVAGFLDVRADRTLTWPEKQEIGELRLNFVRLSKKAGPVKVAIIAASPLIVGILLIWVIANNVFNIPAVLETMRGGSMSDISAGIRQLTSTPDVWLWAYLAFTIGNTMMPANFKDLRGWWVIIGIIAIVALVLFALGAGSQIMTHNLAGPITSAINTLSSTFAILIALDLFFTLGLAIIENTVEWITGDSATFKNGKMITMRRSELRALREQEIQRERQKTARRPATAAASGPPSIYKLQLPIPGPPGKESVTQLPTGIVQPEARPAFGPSLASSGRHGPDVVTGTASERPASASPTMPIRPAAPSSVSIARPAEETESSEIMEKPVPILRSQPSAFTPQKPAATHSEEEAEEDEGERLENPRPFASAPAKPESTFAPRPGSFTPIKPALSAGSGDEESGETTAFTRKLSPPGSPFTPFGSAPNPETDDVEDSEEQEEVSGKENPFTLSRPVNPFSRPVNKPPTGEDDDETQGDDEEPV